MIPSLTKATTLLLTLLAILTTQAQADGIICGTFLGSYDTPNWANGVTVVGTTAYVADWASGLQIIDVSDCSSCLADLDGNGVLDFFDISGFLLYFQIQDPLADFTGDGIFNFFDVSAFLQAFSAGCP